MTTTHLTPDEYRYLWDAAQGVPPRLFPRPLRRCLVRRGLLSPALDVTDQGFQLLVAHAPRCRWTAPYQPGVVSRPSLVIWAVLGAAFFPPPSRS